MNTPKPNTPNRSPCPQLRQEYKGLSWDEPLTEEKIRNIEQNFGPLATTLSELADLVRKCYYEPPKGVPDGKGENVIDATHHIEYEKDSFLAVPPESYGLVIRTLASAKFCREPIEMTVGAQQAKKFYYEIIRAIQGLNIAPDVFQGKIKYEGELAVEAIAQTIDKWHRNNLAILTKTAAIDEAKGGEENPSRSKFTRVMKQVKNVVEKAWQIFTKSFWETVFDRVWHK
jgi:hypothetical protein